MICPAGRASCAEGGHFVAGIPCLGSSSDPGPRVAKHSMIFLGAMVVAAPVDDALLDGLGFEVLGEGLADEGGELRV
jgi:hypothetical protein